MAPRRLLDKHRSGRQASRPGWVACRAGTAPLIEPGGAGMVDIPFDSEERGRYRRGMPTEPVRESGRVLAALVDLTDAMRPHDLRLGQALANALLFEFGPHTELARLFHVEDDVLAEAIAKYAARLRSSTDG